MAVTIHQRREEQFQAALEVRKGRVRGDRSWDGAARIWADDSVGACGQTFSVVWLRVRLFHVVGLWKTKKTYSFSLGVIDSLLLSSVIHHSFYQHHQHIFSAYRVP